MEAGSLRPARGGSAGRPAVVLLALLLLLGRAADAKPTTRKASHKTAITQKTIIQNVAKTVASDTQEAAAVEQTVDNAHNPDALKVCVMTADFWGLKSAGGTATAYHLLAALLAKSPLLHVTFLGVTKKTSLCKNARAVNEKPNLRWECLEPSHFVPDIVETYPYEQLSHAVLAWFREDPARCDVVHGHEWGGVFVDAITMAYLRQLKPGLRFAVQPHGGHFWSSQGQVQRPMDVISLRIDNQERMVNDLNDYLISPTNYMVAFLRQRAWRLPEQTLTIPNIIPEVDPETEALMGREKPVTRLAFFSRLEERKGIKLFVDAINLLNVTRPDFEVFFVGTEAKIDMRPSSLWLRERTAHWPFRTHLKIGVKRDEALDILSTEGTLLVLCSLIDNMPYVVAEAAVKGIPFLAFDAGGVLEMFDGKVHKDNVVLDPTLAALSAKLAEVVQRGSIKSVRLAERVTSGREQWLDWHTNFAKQHPQLIKEDQALARRADAAVAAQAQPVQVVRLQERHHALQLWEELCDAPEAEMAGRPPLLLLPVGYAFAEDREEVLQEMARALKLNELRGSRVGAFAFGSQIPGGRVAYPTSPTWMTYAGDDSKCMDDIPLLVRPETFCTAFLAEARVFRHYYSWVLTMLLGQQGYGTHSYPLVAFRVSNFTSFGYSCMPDKVPVDRKLSFPVASNLYTDSEELLRNLHLAPYLKPIVSLIDDFPTQQRHKGWSFGYLTNDTHDKQIQWLQWRESESGLLRDGAWACGASAHDYPKMHHSLMHPCAGQGASCCGNYPNTPFLLRYESFFYSRSALLVLAYEVWPICGDGLDFVVRLTPASTHKPVILLKRSYEADPNGSPNRQKIEWRLNVRTGDVIDFVVNPRANHDCDGVYVVDVQVWTDNDRMTATV